MTAEQINDRIRKLQELQKSVEREREYQLTHWNGSDGQERYIRNLGSVMNDIQWEIHSMRVKAEIDGCVMLNADGTPYTLTMRNDCNGLGRNNESCAKG